MAIHALAGKTAPKDMHALSEPAFATALEVLAGNGVEVMIDRDDGPTPTPAVSHAILIYNRARRSGLADGIVITPSHDPPEDGGFKYNNQVVDPTFSFMSLDWDGKIRMDGSSPHGMAKLIGLKDRFDIAFGNDTDSDRHGIVTRSAGLMNPNHYLAAAIFHLCTHRPDWRADAAISKTVVSSSTIDRVAAKTGRRLVEVYLGENHL